MKRVVIAVVLAACGGFTFNLIQNASPPDPIIKAKEERIPTIEGSSCWFNFFGGSCVDFAYTPYEMRDELEKVVVDAGSEIEIDFERKPIEDSLGASVWESNSSSNVKLDGNILTAPTEPGSYVYSIRANWDKGSAGYMFQIEVQ